MFRNQINPKVRLKQNCELNSKIPGKRLFVAFLNLFFFLLSEKLWGFIGFFF